MKKLSQPLATCMQNLQQGNLAINLQITAPSVATGISGIFVPIDKWWRGVVVKNWNMPKMQLLPSTTHPHMHMSYFGSYVISSITISTTWFFSLDVILISISHSSLIIFNNWGLLFDLCFKRYLYLFTVEKYVTHSCLYQAGRFFRQHSLYHPN